MVHWVSLIIVILFTMHVHFQTNLILHSCIHCTKGLNGCVRLGIGSFLLTFLPLNYLEWKTPDLLNESFLTNANNLNFRRKNYLYFPRIIHLIARSFTFYIYEIYNSIFSLNKNYFNIRKYYHLSVSVIQQFTLVWVICVS